MESLKPTILRDAISKHKLATILAIGITIRLILIPISGHPLDMYVWYDASLSIVKNGPFSVQLFPPIQGGLLLVPFAFLYDWLSHNFALGPLAPLPMASVPSSLDFYPNLQAQYIPGLLFNFIIKLPLLLSDVLATLLIYKISTDLTNNKRLAEKAAILWFLNPYLIWISAAWGMWDTMPALLSLASLYLIYRKRPFLSSISLTAAIILKLYPAIFLIPICIYFIKTRQPLKSLIRYLSPLLVLLPFFFMYLNSFTNFISGWFFPNNEVLIDIATNIDNPLGFGLTYWSIYGLNRLIGLRFTPEIVSFLILLSVTFMGLLLILAYRKASKLTFQNPLQDLNYAFLLCVFAIFLSFRMICEQFLVWALPFLVIFYLQAKKTQIYWGISLVAFFYIILNCPLPFFFISLSPWFANNLQIMAQYFLSNEFFRLSTLSALGILFSVLIVFVLVRAKIESRSHERNNP